MQNGHYSSPSCSAFASALLVSAICSNAFINSSANFETCSHARREPRFSRTFSHDEALAPSTPCWTILAEANSVTRRQPADSNVSWNLTKRSRSRSSSQDISSCVGIAADSSGPTPTRTSFVIYTLPSELLLRCCGRLLGLLLCCPECEMGLGQLDLVLLASHIEALEFDGKAGHLSLHLIAVSSCVRHRLLRISEKLLDRGDLDAVVEDLALGVSGHSHELEILEILLALLSLGRRRRRRGVDRLHDLGLVVDAGEVDDALGNGCSDLRICLRHHAHELCKLHGLNLTGHNSKSRHHAEVEVLRIAARCELHVAPHRLLE